MAFIVLVVGHLGKPDKDDPGAGYDLDGDGVVGRDEQESQFTPEIALGALKVLRAHGHRVALAGHGTYEERVGWAIRCGADVVAHVHVNAGGGKYGLVNHLKGSMQGLALASAVAVALRKLVPRVEVATPEDGYPRAASLLNLTAKAKPVSIVYEPVFIDQPDHEHLLVGGGEALGEALGRGIISYLGG